MTQESGAATVVQGAQKCLEDGSIEELEVYMTSGSSLDLSDAWTLASQAKDSVNATAICKVISAILLKVDREEAFAKSASSFIRRVLVENRSQIWQNLVSLRPMYANPTLRLLITMADFDLGAVANDVYTTLEFDTNDRLRKLLIKSGPQTQKPTKGSRSSEKQRRTDGVSKDVTRQLCMTLLCSLLKFCSASAQAGIVKCKPVMAEFTKHLSSDDEAFLIDIVKRLTALLDSQVMSQATRVEFFSINNLRLFSALHFRIASELESMKDDDVEMADITMQNASSHQDSSSEERDATPKIDTLKSLDDALLSLFNQVVAPAGQGVCFRSSGLVPPKSKQVYNPVLESFILTLRPVSLETHYQLVLDTLEASPELIAPWSKSCGLNLSPVLSSEWIRSMQLIQAVIELPLPTDTTLHLSSIPEDVLRENILPTRLSSIAEKALKHEDDLVKYMTCRVLSSCMKKIAQFKTNRNEVLNFIAKVQERMPRLETILPLATELIQSATQETKILLRSQAIQLLSQYVTTFEVDERQRFDFGNLFNIIMASSFVDHDNDLVSFIRLQGDASTSIESTATYATAEEQSAVVAMIPCLENVQIHVKRKDRHSIFRLLLTYIVQRPLLESETAANILYGVISLKSMAFQGLTATIVPVCCNRLEAFYTPILELHAATSHETELILDFMDDCFRRFEAEPYKYWDLLADLCAAHQVDLQCNHVSTIVMTLHAQLKYLKERRFAHADMLDEWLARVSANLVAIGENRNIHMAMNQRPLPSKHFTGRLTLFNAVQVAFSLFSTTIASSESATSSESLDWDLVTHALHQLPSTDKQAFRRFFIESCLESKLDRHVTAEKLIAVFCRSSMAGFMTAHKRASLLMEQLLRTASHVEAGQLQNLLTSPDALHLIQNLCPTAEVVRSTVKSGLLNCLEKSDSYDLSIILETFLQPTDFRNIGLVRSVTRILEQGILEAFSLAKYIPGRDIADQSPNMDRAYTRAISLCLAAHLRVSGEEAHPSFVKWAEEADLEDAAPIMAALLNSSLQENREYGRRSLQHHTLSSGILLKVNDQFDSVLLCFKEQLSLDTNTRAESLKDIVLAVTQDAQGSGLHIRKGLLLMQALDITDEEVLTLDMDAALLSYHALLVESMRTQFAEQRRPENKDLDPAYCELLTLIASYIRKNARFVDDIGGSSMEILIQVALENQVDHVEVLVLLTAFVYSSTKEAFNYTRAIQSLFARPSTFYQETKSAAISLAHAMILHNPKSANVAIMDEILKLHKGTLTQDDKMLFDILRSLETALGVSIASRVKSWRLVEDSTDGSRSGRSVEMVLSSAMALHTILNFIDHDAVPANEPALVDYDSVYDVRWTQTLIACFLMGDSSASMLENLIKHRALGLIFVSLASHHLETRMRALRLLSYFHKALLESSLYNKPQILSLLTKFHNSLVEDDLIGNPMPLLHSVFLALSVDILMEPAHFLYVQLNVFILARPDLDLTDVPLFMESLAASEDHTKKTLWMLELLQTGVRRGEGGPLTRRHVPDLYMGQYSVVSDRIREAMLKLFSKIRRELPDVWERFGGPSWAIMTKTQVP